MQPRRMRFILFSSLYVLLGVPLAAASPAITDDEPRFDRVTELPVGQADWVSMDGSLVAFGSGTRVFLVETIPTTVVEKEHPQSLRHREHPLVVRDRPQHLPAQPLGP